MDEVTPVGENALDAKGLAERIADYVETAHTYGQWSKREAMIEAVRIAVEDARHDTLRVLGKHCATCDDEGWVTVSEHGCGGDERRCESECPVPAQARCPDCSRPTRPTVEAGDEPF